MKDKDKVEAMEGLKAIGDKFSNEVDEIPIHWTIFIGIILLVAAVYVEEK